MFFTWISYSLQLSKAYFAFLEVLFNSHIVYILNLDTSTFLHIVGSLESGIKGLDTGIASQVCVRSLFYEQNQFYHHPLVSNLRLHFQKITCY